MSNEYLDCYTRVSTTQQKTDGNSLEVQEVLGKEVSKKLGLKFRHRNEGSQSSTIGYREVLAELKHDITQGKVKNIWVQDSSRMFRSHEGILFRKDFIEKYGVSLYEGDTPTKVTFDSSSDRLVYDIITLVQVQNNEDRTEKFQRGKIHKLKHHSPSKPIYLGGTPLYGYENIDKMWKVNPEESKWVKWIFLSYENGLSTKDIKDHLDKEGVEPRRTSNNLWNLGTLQNMLSNKTYTGIHTVNQYEKCSVEEYTRNVDKNPNSYVKLGGQYKRSIKTFSYKVPKIISIGQFNRVRVHMDKNLKTKSNSKQHFSMLEDLLVCECGTRFGSLVRSGKTKSSMGYIVKTRKYYCLSIEYDWKSGKKKDCKNKMSLNMDMTNDYVLDFVTDVVSQSSILKEKYKVEVMTQKNSRVKDIKGEEKKLETKIQRLQNEIERIENKIVDMEVDIDFGKKDRNIVQKIIQRFYDELESTKTECEKTETEIDNLGKEIKWLDWISGYGKQIEVNTTTDKKKREFLLGALDKIVVKSEFGFGRDKTKKVQRGHTLDFHFKLKIVDDSIEIDKTTKPRNYQVIEGRKNTKSSVIRMVTPRTKKKRI